MVEVGMTPAEVLKSMGETPAKCFPFLADRGTIEVGKRADLVLVEGNPTPNISACRKIKQVWVKGRSSERHCACTNFLCHFVTFNGKLKYFSKKVCNFVTEILNYMLQLDLFPTLYAVEETQNSTTFQDNMKLPLHRWYRYTAGFSGAWVGSLIEKGKLEGRHRVIDPFAGSGTVMVESMLHGVDSYGIESNPYVYNIATAKLQWNDFDSEYLMHESIDVLKRARTKAIDRTELLYESAQSGIHQPARSSLAAPDVRPASSSCLHSGGGSGKNYPPLQTDFLTPKNIPNKLRETGTLQSTTKDCDVPFCVLYFSKNMFINLISNF